MRIGYSHWNIECSISLLLPGAMTTEYTWNIPFTHHFFPLKGKPVWLVSSQQRFTYPMFNTLYEKYNEAFSWP